MPPPVVGLLRGVYGGAGMFEAHCQCIGQDGEAMSSSEGRSSNLRSIVDQATTRTLKLRPIVFRTTSRTLKLRPIVFRTTSAQLPRSKD